MIVRLKETGWQIIYHRAHALLAAQLAGQWRKKDSPARLYETIAAISHHDDLERELEGDHLTEAGAPQDFTLVDETSIQQMDELVASALYRSRWVAMLTSMHQCRLNGEKRGTSAELDQFLDKQIELQKGWRKELKIAKDDVDQAYAFMQWCDRLSLILCQGELPADERSLEISKGPDGERYDIVERNNGSLAVSPWPFENESFIVNVEAHLLSQVKFEDDQSLTEALKQAPVTLLEWTFKR